MFFSQNKNKEIVSLSSRSFLREWIFLNISVGKFTRSQNRASSSSTETGLPNARCSSLIFLSAFLLSLLARDCDFRSRSRGSGSDVEKDEGECDIGGKGTVGATESAESGAELPPSSRGPLRIESGDPLDCSACISVATLAAVMVAVVVVGVVVVVVVEVVMVVMKPSAVGRSFNLDLDLDGGGLLSSGTIEVRRKVVLWPWLSPRVPLVSLAGFVRNRGVRVASVKRDTSGNERCLMRWNSESGKNSCFIFLRLKCDIDNRVLFRGWL